MKLIIYLIMLILRDVFLSDVMQEKLRVLIQIRHIRYLAELLHLCRLSHGQRKGFTTTYSILAPFNVG